MKIIINKDMVAKSKKTTIKFGILLGVIVLGNSLFKLYNGLIGTTDFILIICCVIYISILVSALKKLNMKKTNL